ncbi:Uracil permease [Lachnellula arida]|uniref:Uracil permease n=1 Tax=Lachnellula arida TaxID=1316785 RepID=A0A8T9BMR8_9HELO|nr:Uracil permease [Lachnellula arida]
MAPGIVKRFKLESEPVGGTTWPSLLGFWIAEAFSISMHQVASSSISKGLSPGMAIGAVLVGHVLVCIPAMANSYVGCIYGVNFPVLMRSTFGVRGVYFAVFVRGVVACIYRVRYSKLPRRTMHSNNVVSNLALISTFPKPYPTKLACHLGSTALLLPLHHNSIAPPMATCLQAKIPVHGKNDCDANLRAYTVHLGLVATKGFGPTFSKGTHINDGTPVAVVFFQCITTAIGPKATLALNMPDFTRYAKYPKQVFWTQAVGLCVLVTLSGILGVTVTSACQQIYGVTTWNPLQVSVLWENRAAQFFSALCWMFAANSVSFSNDLSLWFPSWINARRGAYVCCVISVAATSWNIQYSAASSLFS